MIAEKKIKNIKKDMKEFMNQFEQKEVIEEKPKKKYVNVKELKHVGYFEGQIQFRNINEEILNYVDNRIIHANESVPKVTHHSEWNLDYHLSSKKLIRQLGKELIKKFGGTIKESAKLFSKDKQTGKDIYRLNLLYRANEIKKGEVVILEKHATPFIVISCVRDMAVLQDLLTGKKSKIKIDKFGDKLSTYNTQIISISPDIEVLDKDYAPIKLKTSNNDLKINQKVNVVYYKGDCFFVS